jgi:hypothetical protein
MPLRRAGHLDIRFGREAFRDETRFVLARAITLRQGTARGEAPPFYWAKNARRIGICRETASTTRAPKAPCTTPDLNGWSA